MNAATLLKTATALPLVAMLALAGCGGGGGGSVKSDPPPSDPPPSGPPPSGPPPSGPPVSGPPANGTPPVLYRGLPVIHLEVTDEVDVANSGAFSVTKIQGQSIFADEYARHKVVCPGGPTDGNKCTSTESEVDGTLYKNLPEDNYSTDIWVNRYLSDMTITQGVKQIDDISMWRATWNPEPNILLYGSWLTHSVFFVSGGPEDLRPGIDEAIQGVAFGNLYSGRPAQTNATWHGAMVGRTVIEGYEVDGKALIEYNFQNNAVDVELSEIAATGSDGGYYTGPTMFNWDEVRQNNDGSFFIPGHGNDRAGSDPHPTKGYIDGDFYGPNAEEVAGVFEFSYMRTDPRAEINIRGSRREDGVLGAFGGKRQ